MEEMRTKLMFIDIIHREEKTDKEGDRGGLLEQRT